MGAIPAKLWPGVGRKTVSDGRSQSGPDGAATVHVNGAQTAVTAIRSASAANAKGAVGRLDLRLALVLRAGNVPEAAFRGLDSNAASAFVGIVDKLV